ncbi:unnamed protein product [Effrenium voratum]|nr:unnamed protein product [Effrenium voratum]
MAYLSFNESFNTNLKFTTDGGDDSDDMLKKDLPLRYTWSIWEQIMQSSDKSSAYSDATHKVASFSTVQSFWKLWNHMPQPSELLEQKRMVREQSDGLHVIDAVMIFRENIRPEWEDKMNAQGGHFQFQLKPGIGGGQVDEYWNNLVLGMIGATIEPANMITGLRLASWPPDRESFARPAKRRLSRVPRATICYVGRRCGMERRRGSSRSLKKPAKRHPLLDLSTTMRRKYLITDIPSKSLNMVGITDHETRSGRQQRNSWQP